MRSTLKVMELLRYVPYLNEDNENIQRLISGLSIIFKDKIEFDEPRSFDEAIRKIKHFYEQSNRIYETKSG